MARRYSFSLRKSQTGTADRPRTPLAEGDGLKFHADVPHEYRARTDTAVFHNIIRYT